MCPPWVKPSSLPGPPLNQMTLNYVQPPAGSSVPYLKIHVTGFIQKHH